MSLREQLESQLGAAEDILAFAESIVRARAASRSGNAFSFETALLAEGVPQITADCLAHGTMRAPSVAKARAQVDRIKALLAGLERYEARKAGVSL